MVELNQIYKCSACGNMLQVVHASTGNLVCCGQAMVLLLEKIQDEGFEKHVPIVKRLKTKIRSYIGSKQHPMLLEHHIEFAELLADGKVYRKHLKPGDKPRAEFCVKADKVHARAYCNVHGLWKSSPEELKKPVQEEAKTTE